MGVITDLKKTTDNNYWYEVNGAWYVQFEIQKKITMVAISQLITN